MRETLHESSAHRVRYNREYDWNRARHLVQNRDDICTLRHDQLRHFLQNFRGRHSYTVTSVSAETKVELNIFAFDEAPFTQTFLQSFQVELGLRVRFRKPHDDADASHLLILRVRKTRPRSC